jgi:SAM-dependent methyltransferase
MTSPELLRCPRCASALRQQTSILFCSACGARYPAKGGVIDLRRRIPPADYLEVSLAEPADEVEPDAWSALVRHHVQKSDDPVGALYEATAVGRASWKLLLDLRPEATVLDLGSGTGLVASSVAPHVSRVVAIDFSLPPLLLAARRFQAFNPGHDITLVVADRDGSLPLADEAFDALFLSAVSDWSPAKGAHLQRLQRLLKPDGQLFWVGDNRLSHENWRPAIRRLLRRPRDGRETSSPPPGGLTFFGYRRALRHAGYANPRWFSLVGTPSFLQGIEPLGPPPPLWRQRRSRGLRARLESHLYSANRYGILATRGNGSRGSLLERIFETIQSELRCESLSIEKFTLSRKDKVILTVDAAGSSWIVRIPMSEGAQESDRVNARMLRTLASREGIERLVPRSLVQGATGAVSFYVESRLAGRALSSRLAALGSATAHALAGLLMDTIHRPSRPRAALELTGQRYDDEVGSRVASLRRLGLSADTLAGLHGYFRDRLGGIRLPFGTLHGDFSLSNILLDDDDQVSGLIDWESGSEESLPVLDAIHYVESAERSLTHDDVGAAIPRMAKGVFVDEAGRRFLMERYERWQIDTVHHEALVYLKWLRHMAYLSRFWLAYDQRRIDAMVTPVVQAILKPGR